jgi:hypothetical protein
MSNMFGEADEVAVTLARVRREGGVIDAKVNGFVPNEAKNDADVDGGTVEELEGNAVME